jgi:chaperone BCS1
VHKYRRRLLSTVDLDPQSKQELLSDLQEFLDEDTENYYYQNGTPYRRGYLFYGPPGTGKTSVSTAIASHYDLRVCVIDLAGMTDTVLQNKFQSLPTRVVIFFEDIDGYRRCRHCQRASTAPV